MMHDELVKQLRELQAITEHCDEQSCDECENRELCDKHDNKTLSGTYKEAADAIEGLSHAVDQMTEWRKNPWIPVTERLPKYGDWVLGIGPKKGYHVCEYRGISHFVYGGDTPWFSAKGRSITVTHWMPLPEPPKEEI